VFWVSSGLVNICCLHSTLQSGNVGNVCNHNHSSRYMKRFQLQFLKPEITQNVAPTQRSLALRIYRSNTQFQIQTSKFRPNTEIIPRLPSASFSNQTNSEHFSIFNTKTFRRSVFSGRKSTQCLLTRRETKCCSFNKCKPRTLFFFRFQRYNR